MTLEVGSLLYHRYQIHSVIAHGGMGAIYRAHDDTLGVEVAVKENLFTNADYSRQFHREATILAGLRHPNLPRVTDHFVIDGQGQYLVMDFIEGDDLRKRMARTSGVNETEVLLIGIAICNALDYLHSRKPPILHRDIKPGNIKITPRGQIFLVDFGLAKILHSGQATTMGAQSLTPGYAPPEQYGQGTDTRSDIYSLAATLYAALTDVLPEDGLSRAMGSAVLTPLRQRNPNISERVAAVIERGMDINPEIRYQTGAEFKQALMGSNTLIRQRVDGVDEIRIDLLEGGWPSPEKRPAAPEITVAAASPEPIPLPPLASAPVKNSKPKWILPTAGIILVIFCIAGAIPFLPGVFGRNQPNPSSTTTPNPDLSSAAPEPTRAAAVIQPSRPPFPDPTPSVSQLTPTNQPTLAPTSETEPTVQFTPVGGGSGTIAFASNRSGKFQIYRMDPDGKNIRQVTTLSDGACQPDWSSDGKRLVFVSPCLKDQVQYKGSGLFLVNLDGTGVVPLRTTPGGDYEPAWSPDGQLIAFTSLRDGRPHIYLYNLADQTAVNLSRPSSTDRQPAWSPDGKLIAFTTIRSDHYQVYLIGKEGNNAREFSNQAGGIAQYPTWSPDGQVILFSSGENKPILVAKRIDDRINEFPVSDTIRPVYNSSFSPDGNWVLFASTMDKNPEIYRMTRNGTGLVRLTDDPGADIDPVWIKK